MNTKTLANAGSVFVSKDEVRDIVTPTAATGRKSVGAKVSTRATFKPQWGVNNQHGRTTHPKNNYKRAESQLE